MKSLKRNWPLIALAVWITVVVVGAGMTFGLPWR